MKRTRVSWSNDVDQVEGPCAVCGKNVFFVIPSDRPDPALLYHSTCDMMPLIREQLKKATPPLMPAQYVISKPKPVAPSAAAAPAPAPVAVPTPPPPSTPASPQ